jgi:hypothetical protein
VDRPAGEEELVSVTSLDTLRNTVEAFVTEATREFYLHNSGQKDTLEMAAVVARHGAAFTAEAMRACLDAADRARDAAEKRRHVALAQAVAEACMERELAAPGDELATAEAQATVEVDGETVPYFSAAVMLQNEPDRARRRRIDAARRAELARLNPLREKLLRRHHELIAELGFAGYVEFYSTLKGIDVPALGEQLQAFLARTASLYREHLGPWFEEVIGVPFAQAERHDAALLFRMTAHDAWFAGDRMVPLLRSTLLGLGVALDDQPNVHLDTEDRPRKNPRAFCAPVRTPDEVYLVIRPSGGYQDFRALFHEAGHTEHYAHVERTRPFEERDLGDNSVTEAFAFTMEHLLLDADWLRDSVGIDGDALRRLQHSAFVYYLYMMRRYAAKVTYELELHRGGPDRLAAMPQHYAQWLTEHLGFRYSEEAYLDDVDPGFYSSQYVRAWMLEAQLVARWRQRHGARWWRPGAAGDELRALWSLGQALPAHLLSAELGMPGLGIEALEQRIRDGLEASA